jgi:hypothetical protein
MNDLGEKIPKTVGIISVSNDSTCYWTWECANYKEDRSAIAHVKQASKVGKIFGHRDWSELIYTTDSRKQRFNYLGNCFFIVECSKNRKGKWKSSLRLTFFPV